MQISTLVQDLGIRLLVTCDDWFRGEVNSIVICKRRLSTVAPDVDVSRLVNRPSLVANDVTEFIRRGGYYPPPQKKKNSSVLR